jgi:hydrogenase maturation protein HypF
MLQKRKEAYQFIIEGQVQGVGFRPSVVRIAKELNLTGFVRNIVSGVEIQVQGIEKNINQFEKLLLKKKPKLSKINKISKIKLKTSLKFIDFQILQSSSEINNSVFSNLIPPDVKICDDCLKELRDMDNRRYGYFLTNCTNCGPRYTITKTVPYDRTNTSMSVFKMCTQCTQEYNDPSNRRYHAQPISCHKCGPELKLFTNTKVIAKNNEATIQNTLNSLRGFQDVVVYDNGSVDTTIDIC